MLLSPQRATKAFTLLELVVVIVVLGLLAALAIPTFSRVTTKARDAAAAATLAATMRDAQALMAFAEEGYTWNDALETAVSELPSASGTGFFAAGLVAEETSTLPTPSRASYEVHPATATAPGFVVLSMRSLSEHVCVGVATLTASSSPSCLAPEALKPGETPVSRVLSGDVAPLPSGVAPVRAPSAPSGVSARAGVLSAEVTWSHSEALGSPPAEHFLVTSSTGMTLQATSSPFTFPGLTAGTPVSFSVKAVRAGTSSTSSAPSVPVSPLTPVPAPGAPSALTASLSGTTATLTWPTVANAASYELLVGPELVGSALAPATSTTVPVAPGSTTTFSIRAKNASGTSAVTSAAPVTAAPSAPVLTARANARVVTLEWPAAAGTTTYVVKRGTTQVYSGPARTFTETLSTGGSYTYTLSASNAGGTSALSSATVNVLNAPTGVSAAAGDRGASVSFNPVAGATSYTATSTPGGVTVTGASSPLVVTGLTNGTAYTFTVTATGADGAAATSSATTAVTPSKTTTLSYTGGLQTFVPTTSGAYEVTAAGGQGGSITSSYTGGLGARVSGTTNLVAGQKYYVVVGGSPSVSNVAGGGGASFVWSGEGAAASPLLVAGAGGGAGTGNGNAGSGVLTAPGTGSGGAAGGSTGAAGGGGWLSAGGSVSYVHPSNGYNYTAGGGSACKPSAGTCGGGNGVWSAYTYGAGGSGFGVGNLSGGGGGGYTGGNGGNGGPGAGGRSYADSSLSSTAGATGAIAGNGWVKFTLLD